MTVSRCAWVPLDNPLYLAYHDSEWGVPVHDDRLLFEFLVLEGAQAGLSWLTILRKRERYRQVFDGFDIAAVSAVRCREGGSAAGDAGIVRNRKKVEAAVRLARVALEIQQEAGSLDTFLWSFVNGHPRSRRGTRSPRYPPARPPRMR